MPNRPETYRGPYVENTESGPKSTKQALQFGEELKNYYNQKFSAERAAIAEEITIHNLPDDEELNFLGELEGNGQALIAYIRDNCPALKTAMGSAPQLGEVIYASIMEQTHGSGFDANADFVKGTKITMENGHVTVMHNGEAVEFDLFADWLFVQAEEQANALNDEPAAPDALVAEDAPAEPAGDDRSLDTGQNAVDEAAADRMPAVVPTVEEPAPEAPAEEPAVEGEQLDHLLGQGQDTEAEAKKQSDASEKPVPAPQVVDTPPAEDSAPAEEPAVESAVDEPKPDAPNEEPAKKPRGINRLFRKKDTPAEGQADAPVDGATPEQANVLNDAPTAPDAPAEEPATNAPGLKDILNNGIPAVVEVTAQDEAVKKLTSAYTPEELSGMTDPAGIRALLGVLQTTEATLQGDALQANQEKQAQLQARIDELEAPEQGTE